ncbi:MAG: helix-turn-helix domain-containing protein [Pseudomonadota bacterium]
MAESTITSEVDLADAKAQALRSILKAQFLEQQIEPLVERTATQFGISRSTVFRWLKKFKEGDARLSALKPTPPGPAPGKERKISEEQHKLIVSAEAHDVGDLEFLRHLGLPMTRLWRLDLEPTIDHANRSACATGRTPEQIRSMSISALGRPAVDFMQDGIIFSTARTVSQYRIGVF